MIFPRQHAQCEVGMVLQSCEVPLFAITSSDERSRAERAGTEISNHFEFLIMGGMEGAGERLCNRIATL